MTHVVTTHRSPNQSPRPAGSLITAIVMHATASGDCRQDVEWLCMPLSGASAHVVIDRNADVYDLVPVERKAWHAGVSELDGKPNVNDFSIGIELANSNKGETYPDAQLACAAALCAAYIREWPGITVDRIVTHAEIARPAGRKSDPAPPFSIEAFRQLVRDELGQ